MDKILSHSAFTMECGKPTEAYSYITRAFIRAFGPDAKLRDFVCAIDIDFPLPAMVLRANWHDVRHKMLGSVTGFGRSKVLDSFGDTMTPYHIAGSFILESAVVDSCDLPSGCTFSIGRPGLNVLGINTHALSHAPPSVVPLVVHRFLSTPRP